MGAIDGTHIPVSMPMSQPVPYYNRKGFKSIILQAICDHTGLFMDIFAAFPGSAHDARVLSNSDVGIAGRAAIPDPFFLLGDSGYPLETWLMTPYRSATSLQEIKYNKVQASCRVVIEQAFGRLKSRWRAMKLLYCGGHEHAVMLIETACMLHNWCQRNEGVWVPPDDEDDDDGAADELLHAEQFRSEAARRRAAEGVRDRIAMRL
jgi:hypothetical protein